MKEKEGKYVYLSQEGDILIARYKAGLHIDLEAAQSIIDDRLTFTKNKDVPVLLLDSGLVKMDKNARDFMSSDEGIRGLRSIAIILTSVVNSMLLNFLLKISRPGLPVKVFTDKKLAMDWLQTFVDEDQPG
jgi:hypothetical protein